jgi:nucleoside-diphosphate-sugar epimerase
VPGVVSSARSGSIFVTGGSGFIGRHFLEALRAGGFERVTCLTRKPVSAATETPGWKFLPGDLATPESYSSHLAQADLVVHLAAATGNASPEELRRINVDATLRLLHECERHGVSRMLYISSIAAKYRDLEHYAYGRSKADAEAAVRQSRVDYTILRPTIVLGQGSPIGQRLRTMAMLPLPLVIGNGKTRIQPIDVADVARAMILLLERSRFSGEILELGGPEVLTFEELIRRIRAAAHRPATPLLHLPVGPLRGILSAASQVFGSRIPVSAGQLVPFTSDGVADPNDLATELRPAMTTLDTLLGALAGNQ